MAYLFSDKSGNFSVKFRFGKREFTKSLHTRDRRAAELGAARVDDALMRLKRGLLTLPDGAEPGEFIVSGGTLTAKPKPLDRPSTTRPTTLGQLWDAYVEGMPEASKESSTLYTEGIHRKHLTRILSAEKEVEGITPAVAQDYVTRRGKEKHNGRAIGPQTIKKELKTLRHVWKWGFKLGHVKAGCPWQLKDLRWGRDEGREPFQTYAQIRAKIDRGGLKDDQIARLWECLYLDGKEIREVLAHVKEHAPARYVYPMVVFCATTGARRSELCRSRIDDFDFGNGVVHLRERKRDQSKRETIRNVPMHPLLRETMTAWFDDHPGGQFTLAQDDGRPVSVHLAYEHFKATLATSEKWRVIRGFHTFRHSFASILASKGIDQRIIDSLMGHQTEEMRARYQHLFPDTKENAVMTLPATVSSSRIV